LSLKQCASIDQNGNSANPSWPEQIFFVPANIHFNTATGHGDFIASIAVGSKIWDVYVSETANDGASYKIAEVVTTGKFIASSFSDSALFYQHDRGEDDNC
jgi:hypothetical protein